MKVGILGGGLLSLSLANLVAIKEALANVS